MKKILKVLGVLVLLLLLAGGGFFVWASTASARALERTIETHRVDFPIPFPLDSAEAAGMDIVLAGYSGLLNFSAEGPSAPPEPITATPAGSESRRPAAGCRRWRRRRCGSGNPVG